jgi:AraC family transcriptional regulator of adaptative response/methylated-DNA-[protein]-cysteine methyltransferase
MTKTISLRFAFGTSTLGRFVVATSDHGLVAILFGSNDEHLSRELARARPEAEWIEDAAGLAAVRAQVAALLSNPHHGLAIPLDVSGSPLECAVWDVLRAIPVGKTMSYGQIAKSLAVAATAQAVGAACAANVLAVAIPCHRVLKADGSISGYRWGVERKRRLLALEVAS